MNEDVMTKKSAEELIRFSEEFRNRESAYFRDLTAKAFLYMKDYIEKDIKSYSEYAIILSVEEWKDEVLKELEQIKRMIASQCDIIFNKENAEIFRENKLTAEMLMTGESAKYASVSWFNGVL